MIRWLRYLFLAALGLGLLVVALANRGPVELRLLPRDLGTFMGLDLAVRLPLFVVILAGIAAGLLIGFVWEWLREARHRAAASRTARAVAQLQREVSSLRDDNARPKDEVLAILADKRKAG